MLTDQCFRPWYIFISQTKIEQQKDEIFIQTWPEKKCHFEHPSVDLEYYILHVYFLGVRTQLAFVRPVGEVIDARNKIATLDAASTDNVRMALAFAWRVGMAFIVL